MNFLSSLKFCAESPYAYGYSDLSGNLTLSWGKTPLAAASLKKNVSTLRWQDFFASAEPKEFSLEFSQRFDRADTISASSPLRVKDRRIDPDFESWKNYCRKIDAGIEEKRFSKIVPARTESWQIDNLENFDLLLRLFSKPDGKTYRFFLSWEGRLFFGASPELLFQIQGDEIFIPCIAGTKPFDPLRPLSEKEKQHFLQDGKEREEHLFVVKGITEALEKISLRPESVPAPSILELPGLLHLYTPLRVRGAKNLKERGEMNAAALLSLLHPTPAVGGYPRAEALAFLAQEEPWNRGIFASPLLFQSAEGALAIVGIRSALWQKNVLTFFAGAGYVKGSTPEKEWQETEKKMLFLKNILTIQE